MAHPQGLSFQLLKCIHRPSLCARMELEVNWMPEKGKQTCVVRKTENEN